jgi:hypothetical protein
MRNQIYIFIIALFIILFGILQINAFSVGSGVHLNISIDNTNSTPAVNQTDPNNNHSGYTLPENVNDTENNNGDENTYTDNTDIQTNNNAINVPTHVATGDNSDSENYIGEDISTDTKDTIQNETTDSITGASISPIGFARDNWRVFLILPTIILAILLIIVIYLYKRKQDEFFESEKKRFTKIINKKKTKKRKKK